ncbi:ABC transporter ATP-binding protein [Rhodovibrio salinarum]|uniref:ABC transporter ATP-binding protein n=1 Tax=Rhodovibrio salinarum TaxID=1087 RepID=A0A934QL22_9PROT|nr:ABC transporter ATP-binding protein [Rhodovibrio salinarum]MBK1698555.1 ABC transporter ATP-binding protein [Rhodovibrio salinarum]
MTNDAVVRLTGVHKRFGDFVALEKLDLEIQRGEFLTLLGESGCGKTTTLRIVSGFEEPTEGAVYLNGELANGVPPHRRRVNTVFQNYALFPHMSVGDNVGYGLRFDGVGRRERRRRAAEMLARVGLEDKIDNAPDALSGGQMQRAALARALIKEPEVLLLDEPLSALDAKLRKELQLELKRVQRQTGITFIYVTHDQEEALVMSDRIAVMESGKIRQLGSPDDIFERPHSRFVAEFVGASNKLDGVVRETAGNTVQVALPSGERLSAMAPPTGTLDVGTAVRLVIRTQQLRIEDDAVAPAENLLNATLADVIYLGVDRKLELHLADGQRIELEERGDRLPADLSERIGRSIRLQVPQDAVHAFPSGA